jgi:dienelactone hydrolase
MDQMGHGERIQTYPWNREGYRARYLTGMQFYVAGESLIKWMVWDVMRGIDLLLARPDVARDKIVMLGAVAGGGEPAALTAALDPRVAALVPFTYGESIPELGPGGTEFPGLPDSGWGSWETTRNLPRTIVDGVLPWVVCASVAPRRLVYAYELGWDGSVEKAPVWHRYRKIFGFYNALDSLDDAHGFGPFPGPGECANIGAWQRKTLYPELQRWFGIAIPAAEPDDRRPEPELAALTPESAAGLDMKMVHELARESAAAKAAAARAELARLDAGGRRRWLREKWTARLGDIEPALNVNAMARWRKPFGGAEAEAVALVTEPGIVVPVVLLRPAGAPPQAPVVTVISQSGRARLLANRRAQIDALLASGAAVCLPDLRGTGETAEDARRGPQSAGIQDAASELMLGRSMAGARLKDLRTVLAWLAQRPDVDAARIALWGDSDVPPNPPRLLLEEVAGWQMGPQVQRQAEPLGGLLALLGALFEDRVAAVAVRRGLSGYLALLDDPFIYAPSDAIVPDSAACGDLSDIAAALAPRPVLLSGLVDGRNRETAPGPEPGAWLAARLRR